MAVPVIVRSDRGVKPISARMPSEFEPLTFSRPSAMLST
jgi:hypothetical protein